MYWEYRIIDSMVDGNPDGQYELNELGKDGWELCGILTQINTTRFYFKRLATQIYESTDGG